MTDKEKAIVMAYTGITMLSGGKFSIFHKYIEDIMGRPVFTHELASKRVWEQIKEKSSFDFLRLCEGEERPHDKWGNWIITEIRCPNCSEYFQTDCYSMEELKKCPCCDADVMGGRQ